MSRLEQATYPYASGSHGIPFEEEGFGDKMVTGGSGAMLRYRVSERKIAVKDPSREDCFHLFGEVDADSRVLFNLYTRDPNGLRHPDFFARSFMEFAIRNFDLAGIRIDSFVGVWLIDTDNYKQFMNTYRATGDLVQSARSTWTGNIAEANGFTLTGRRNVVLNNEGAWALFNRVPSR